jgi:hypothetical protein
VVSGAGLAARLISQLVEMKTGRPPDVMPSDDRARGERGGGKGRGARGGGGGRNGGGRGDRRARGARGDERPQSREFDLLVDTTGDPVRWRAALAQVRRLGRALLMIPPGPHILPFDFYPQVHRGSVSLIVRRVPAVPRKTAPVNGDGAVHHALRMLRLDGLLAEVGPGPGPASPDGALFRLIGAPDGRGLLLRFGMEATAGG